MYEEPIWNEKFQMIGYVPATPIEEAMKSLDISFEQMIQVLSNDIFPCFKSLIDRYNQE